MTVSTIHVLSSIVCSLVVSIGMIVVVLLWFDDHLLWSMRIAGSLFGMAAFALSIWLLSAHICTHRSLVSTRHYIGFLTRLPQGTAPASEHQDSNEEKKADENGQQYLEFSHVSFHQIERRQAMRQIFVVVCYSFLAVVALWFPPGSAVIEQVKNCYEGFSTLFFYRLLICFFAKPLEKEEDTYDAPRDEGDAAFRAEWPKIAQKAQEAFEGSCCSCCLFDILWFCLKHKHLHCFMEKSLVVYSFSNFLWLVVTIVTECQGVYEEGKLSFHAAYLYTYIGRLIFITPAIVPLFFFIPCLGHSYPERAPGKKFITIKVIVFLGVWQRMALSIIHNTSGVFKDNLPEGRDIGIANNYFTCFESFVLAVVNCVVFSACPPPMCGAKKQLYTHIERDGTKETASEHVGVGSPLVSQAVVATSYDATQPSDGRKEKVEPFAPVVQLSASGPPSSAAPPTFGEAFRFLFSFADVAKFIGLHCQSCNPKIELSN